MIELVFMIVESFGNRHAGHRKVSHTNNRVLVCARRGLCVKPSDTSSIAEESYYTIVPFKVERKIVTCFTFVMSYFLIKPKIASL